MKLRLNRIIAASLAAFILLAAVGCGVSGAEGSTASPEASSSSGAGTSENTSKSSAGAESGPAPVEPQVLRVYYNGGVSVQKPKNQQVHDWILEQTGIDVQREDIPDNNYDEKMKLIIASGEEFDACQIIPLLYSWRQLRDNGTSVKLNGLLEEYGPNIMRLYGDGIYTCADENDDIWAMPRYNADIMFVTGIRQDWLDKLGMEVPDSLVEFEAYMEAVKNTDLDENGVNDEIPYVPWWTLWAFMNGIRPAFLGFGGNEYVNEQGQVVSLYTHPNYKFMLETLHKWYEKGWLYQEFATQSDDKKAELRQAGRVGSFTGWWFGGDSTLNDGIVYSPMPPWTDAPGGVQGWGANMRMDKHMIISSTSSHPELFIKYIDWVCSDPTNFQTVNSGVEDEEWEWVDKENNVISMIDGFADRYSRYYRVLDTFFPELYATVKPNDLLSEDILRVQTQVKSWTPLMSPGWEFVYDGTEADGIGNDGETLIQEVMMRIIYGEDSIDAWDKAVQDYMRIQGDVQSRVMTEQYNRLYKD
ncbi:hypothetical protein FACS1894191_3510 [Clostridia bacterium]|nr:hypothetical protein FACS1894191_3510 [Clostridia bacterium]